MKRIFRTLLATALALPLAAVTASGAQAEANGVGLKPAFGWSSWSFVRSHPTAAKIEAEADAMKNSGLADVGYHNINLDDFWYQCPGSQGPNVDDNGRWVTDQTKFPPSGTTDGIQVVADYVHGQTKSMFMFELLVPAEQAQLDRVKGDKKTYDLEIRPRLMVQAIQELQDVGVEADHRVAVRRRPGVLRREQGQEQGTGHRVYDQLRRHHRPAGRAVPGEPAAAGADRRAHQGPRDRPSHH